MRGSLPTPSKRNVEHRDEFALPLAAVSQTLDVRGRLAAPMLAGLYVASNGRMTDELGKVRKEALAS
jgi:hypothetical protein